MHSMPAATREVIGGIDTHQDLHTAAVVAASGEALATKSFATTPQGYRKTLAWCASFGGLQRVGLARAGVPVLAVTGPDRSLRRAAGKDDGLDAMAAARAALTGQRVQVAKERDGAVEARRVLRTTRKDCRALPTRHAPAASQHDRRRSR